MCLCYIIDIEIDMIFQKSVAIALTYSTINSRTLLIIFSSIGRHIGYFHQQSVTKDNELLR